MKNSLISVILATTALTAPAFAQELTRIATVPVGGEITGLFLEGSDLFFNVQHPDDTLDTAFSKATVGVVANAEKASGWLAKNAILVTALNPVIGYQKGAEVAKEAMATNRTVREVVIEKGYLDAEEADRLLNVRALTDGGIQK